MAEFKSRRFKMTREKFLIMQEKLQTDQKIGEKFGITRQAVFKFRKNHQIAPVKWKKVWRNRDICHMRLNGATLEEIGKKFGASMSQVSRIVRDIPHPRKR